MKISAIVVAALACASPASAEDATRKTITADGVSSVVIETAAGDFAVNGVAGRFVVTVTRYDAGRCALTTETKDGTLRLRAGSKPGRGAGEKGCEAGFSVTAPPAPRAQASGRGLVDFDGVSWPAFGS